MPRLGPSRYIDGKSGTAQRDTSKNGIVYHKKLSKMLYNEKKKRKQPKPFPIKKIKPRLTLDQSNTCEPLDLEVLDLQHFLLVLLGESSVLKVVHEHSK